MINVYTENYGGICNDPFEFEGDYNALDATCKLNCIREKVFHLLVAQEQYTKELSDTEISLLKATDNKSQIDSYRRTMLLLAQRHDQQKPTLQDVIDSDLLDYLHRIQQEHFTDAGADYQKIKAFITKHSRQACFKFLRSSIANLFTNIEKNLKMFTFFDLPIVGSTTSLQEGTTSYQLKKDLFNKLLLPSHLPFTKKESVLKNMLYRMPLTDLLLLDSEAKLEELEPFCTSFGQLVAYAIYQSLNLHLIAQDNKLISEVNRVKEIFAETIGNAQDKALQLKNDLLRSNTSLFFTQEADALLMKALETDFHPIDKQNKSDGTLIFLKKDVWEKEYELINIEAYSHREKGTLNLIIATHQETKEQFLLATGHGSSNDAEDGRDQISLIVEKYHENRCRQGYEKLRLLIGIDANTKKKQDVEALKALLEEKGLETGSLGPTTIKKRMATVQHHKAGKRVADEEDFLIYLKATTDHHHPLVQDLHLGFDNKPLDILPLLPNAAHRSDHLPLGATIILRA